MPRRRHRWMSLLGAGAVLLSVLVAATPSGAQLRPGEGGAGWQAGTQVERDPSTPPPPPAASAGAKPSADQQAPGQLSLAAFLTDNGPQLEQGLVWRVFQDADRSAGGDQKLKLVDIRREPAPSFSLPPGDYAINVAYGRANVSRQITVAAGSTASERIVLNAGGLRVRAVLISGEPVPDMSVSYDVYMGESDQLGGRPKVVSNAKPGVVVRLNAGVYQIVSVYGDANASVRAEVKVEPGKITDAAVSHHCAKVTFKLVARQGGEAQADTRWTIQTNTGDVIIESSGALPSHILAAGAYSVIARNSGRTFKREFIVDPGDPVQVEVVMN